MLNEARVHVGLPRAIHALGAMLGVPTERLKRAMGLEPEALSGPELRLTSAHTRALWTALVAERSEVPLGLLAALISGTASSEPQCPALPLRHRLNALAQFRQSLAK